MASSARIVAISGSTGLMGTALSRALVSQGWSLRRIVRDPKKADPVDIVWNPVAEEMTTSGLEGLDAVVHLAGENIARRRWSSVQKERIYDSRVKGTRLLSKTLASLEKKPKVFICASAVGFYGDREEPVDELSAPGEGFLPDLCRAWEDAAEPARAAGIRVVHARIGVVLSRDGGALKKMLPPFLMCVGGAIGDGRQAMPWISIADAVGAMRHILEKDDLAGAVNLTAPRGVSNGDFSRALGAALRRPAFFPVPACMVRLLLGEMGEALLLGGAPVVPRRLAESGYRFNHPDIRSALKAIVGG